MLPFPDPRRFAPLIWSNNSERPVGFFRIRKWADRSDKREELGGANEDRSRSMAFKESGISLDFNSVIRFMSETTSQVTWKLRGSVEEIARKVEGLPQMKAKYEVLCLATPPDVSCQTVHSLASLFERFTGQEGSLSIAVRFEAREDFEVAFTQFF